MTATQPISPIRARLKAVLESVSGIGNVYDYLRHPVTDAEVKSLFVDSTPRLHYWSVTLGPEEKLIEEDIVGGSHAWITFVIHGYYALKDADATEKTFVDLTEDVLDAIRAEKPGRLAGTVIRIGNRRWVGPNHVEVAGVLCHHAEIVVPVFAAVEC